jgi:hypothetical protein
MSHHVQQGSPPIYYGGNSANSYKQSVNGNGIVDSIGNCTIFFPPTPAGSYYTGTVTVYTSPNAAKWQVQINGQIIDTVTGTSSVGNIQVGSADTLEIVSAGGLQAYVGDTFNATLAAVVTPDYDTQLVVPTNDSVVINTEINLVYNNNIVADGLHNIVLTLLPTTKSLIVAIGEPPSHPFGDTFNAEVVGNQSNIIWSDIIPAGESSAPITPVPGVIAMPCYGLVDSSITVNITCSSSGLTLPLFIIETPDEILNGTLDNPIVTQDYQSNIADTFVSISVATTAVVNLIPAPASGFANVIKQIECHAPTVAAATTLLRAQGDTTGWIPSSCYAQADGTSTSWTGPVISTESISVHNGTAVTAAASASYKVIPILL